MTFREALAQLEFFFLAPALPIAPALRKRLLARSKVWQHESSQGLLPVRPNDPGARASEPQRPVSESRATTSTAIPLLRQDPCQRTDLVPRNRQMLLLRR